MFKILYSISFIVAFFMGMLLCRGYANDATIWIAFVGSLLNGILYASIDSLKEKTKKQSEDIKWLEDELSKVKSQLSDIKKKTKSI